MNIIKYFRNKKLNKDRKRYEKHISELRSEASKVITIRNVNFMAEGKIRPCILINDVIAYVSYEDESTDIMGMMLHLRDKYVDLFQTMPTIKLL